MSRSKQKQTVSGHIAVWSARKPERKGFSLKAAAMCLTAALCLTACGGEEQKQTLLSEELMTSQQANYKTVSVEMGEYAKNFEAKVTVAYPFHTSLYWEESNARYREVLVSRGQAVKEGDVLMIFDIEESKTELETLKLQLLRTKEDFEAGNAERLAVIDAEKLEAEDLKDYDLRIAELEIEKLQAEYEQYVYRCEREIGQIEEKIEALESEMENNQLVAPFDGVIMEVIDYNLGDKVVKGQDLITIYSTDKFLLKPEGSSAALRYNMQVTIEAGYGDNVKSYSARVVAASNILPASVKQNLTLIELEQDIQETELKGKVQFQCNIEELQNILVTESGAVSKEDGKTYVYVLNGDMVQKRYVVTGTGSKEKIWILDGLSEGQTLILD